MANTTNYNWETPDDTDLVKDGAAAIRTLGSSIDTTTKNLNPQTTTGAIAYRSATANVNTALPIGTNGQILAVSAGVPAWINNDQGDITEVQAGTGISVASGTGPIPVVTNTVATKFDAKGDLVVGTGSDTFDRLAVGTNTYILTADSAEATGLKWAAPAVATSALTLVKTQTVGTSVTSVTVNDAFSTTYENYLITYTGGSNASNTADINIKFGAATTNYKYVGIYMQTTSSTVNSFATNSSGSITVGGMSGNGAASFIYVMNPYQTKRTAVIAHTSTTHSDMYWQDYKGFLDDATSYTSFIIASASAMTGGVIRVYGYQNS
jgi:hypothetical protein